MKDCIQDLRVQVLYTNSKCVCVCVCDTLKPQSLSALRQGLPLNSGVVVLARLTGQQALVIYLSLSHKML